MESLSGKLLVAAADLSDPNFARSVVLLIHHDDEGGFGIVLNHPGKARLDTVCRQLFEQPSPVDLPLSVGGPVAGPLLALHASAALAEREVTPGVYFSAQQHLLTALLAEGRQPLRFFVGYAGWGPGQLEAELEEGSWSVTDGDADLVFSDEATQWRRVTTRIADAFLVAALGVKHVPKHPWLN